MTLAPLESALLEGEENNETRQHFRGLMEAVRQTQRDLLDIGADVKNLASVEWASFYASSGEANIVSAIDHQLGGTENRNNVENAGARDMLEKGRVLVQRSKVIHSLAESTYSFWNTSMKRTINSVVALIKAACRGISSLESTGASLCQSDIV